MITSKSEPVGHSRRNNRKLSDEESFEILKKYSIPFPPYGIGSNPLEVGEIADKIGYPVVLKIVSPDISHKTDVGGVALDITSRAEAEAAADQMTRAVRLKMPWARIKGILVQKMITGGLELIIGGIRDPTFGGVVMLGLGGVFTEVMRDVSFRVTPVTRKDVLEMIDELSAKQLLKGYRTLPPANIELIVDLVLKASRVIDELEFIESFDFNPVIVKGSEIFVVDARFIVSET